jgi:hypothetical protein
VSNPIPETPRIGGVAVKLLVVSALVALLSAAGSARADNGTLVGDVGQDDAFVISLTDSTGAKVTHLSAGTYTLIVHDHSSFHNFDLSGPGVSVATDVGGVGDKTFTVTFVDGTYFFQCDPHSSQMHGQFTVGTVTTPPPTTTPTPTQVTVLAGSIGPGAKFALSPSSGLSAGRFRIKVSDRSATDGFRLAGPGVTRSTGAKFKGSATWSLTLKAGKYTFGSLRNPKLRRSFTIAA